MGHVAVRALKATDDEFEATLAALLYVLREWSPLHSAPEFMNQSLGQVRRARLNLERTYLIRLFARFEGLLRDHLRETMPGRQPTSARGLIDRVGTRSRVDTAVLEEAHRVREYRNCLAHDRPPPVNLAFGEARSRLCRFLGRI